MTRFEHQRHKPPRRLDRPRQLVLACAPTRSNVNLSRIVRTAGCCGLPRVICCGTARMINKIAREAPGGVEVEIHRTLPPVLKALCAEGYQIVGLEQASGSEDMHSFRFERRTALVVGNERTGLREAELATVGRVVEIPVWGRPHSYNIATAASIAMYEYCRQFPNG